MATFLWTLSFTQLVLTTSGYVFRGVRPPPRHPPSRVTSPLPHTRKAAAPKATTSDDTVDKSRRRVWNVCGTAAALTVLGSPIMVEPSNAAPPMTPGEADGLGARLERQFRPKAPKVIRSKLDQDFAVLLMRSSYNALDQIDCVAMDQFQRDFFFIRQAEYQPYIDQLGPGVVQQGMLTDPYYFDFIFL